MRVFFALWPSVALARKWHGLARRWHPYTGGRIMPAANLHLTLAFLGEVAEEQLPALQACVADMTAAPVKVQLDAVGHWPHNGIVWLGIRNLPPELAELVAALRQKLAAAGFAFDNKTYVPHITLMRRAACGPVETVKPIVWNSSEFVLAGSTRTDGGSAYTILARWPLVGDVTDKCSEPAAR